MSVVHLHLLLNHVPIVGMPIVLALLVIAAWRRSGELARTAFGLTIALAAVAVGVYLTGEPAEEVVETIPGFSHALVERHEEAALVAVLSIGVVALASLVALAVFRRRTLPRWVIVAGAAGALTVSGLMAWTAGSGGQIRHTEIRTGAAASSYDGPGSGSDADDPRER